MSLLIFKAVNNLAPNYICSKLNMARNSHSHNIRGAEKKHLQISSANNIFGLKTFAVEHQNSGMIYLRNYWK